jgi:hypothetical protein
MEGEECAEGRVKRALDERVWIPSPPTADDTTKSLGSPLETRHDIVCLSKGVHIEGHVVYSTTICFSLLLPKRHTLTNPFILPLTPC